MAQAQSAESLTNAAKAQYDEAKSGARQQDKDTAQAQVRQAQAAVDEVTAARNEVLGLAPSNGEVSKRLADIAISEEHTSELQSRPHLVCRLLLEKKKKCSRDIRKYG